MSKDNNAHFFLVFSKAPNVWRRRRRHFIYRILTENVNVEAIREILGQHFKGGYTTFEGSGFWKGMKEGTIVIEIDGTTAKKARSAAKDIKSLNQQEAVLVQRQPVESILV
jgi:hypothetical protein